MIHHKVEIIPGVEHHDERGTLSFVNDFDMNKVRRFYVITHMDERFVRAWQGHKIENKWFYCISGCFIINVVEIDDWVVPSADLKVQSFILTSNRPEVLHIGGGYVTGIKAQNNGASLMVFSDTGLDESKADDFRYDSSLWFNWSNT